MGHKGEQNELSDCLANSNTMEHFFQGNCSGCPAVNAPDSFSLRNTPSPVLQAYLVETILSSKK